MIPISETISPPPNQVGLGLVAAGYSYSAMASSKPSATSNLIVILRQKIAERGYEYAEETDPHLDCPICRVPFIDPVMPTGCFHIFCRGCLTQALQIAPVCPIDRSQLHADTIRPAPKLIRQMCDELIVNCLHRDAGCPFTGQRHTLERHLQDSCLYAETDCCSNECGETMKKKDLSKHLETCQYRLVECGMCKNSIRFPDLKSHQRSCPQSNVNCPHCSNILKLSSLKEHLSICSEKPVTCPHSKFGCDHVTTRRIMDKEHKVHCPFESIKNFFPIFERRLSLVEKDNQKLKEKLDLSRKREAILGAELQAVRRSLGPYFIPSTPEQYFSEQELRDSVERTRRQPEDHTSRERNNDPPASESGHEAQAFAEANNYHAQLLEANTYLSPAHDIPVASRRGSRSSSQISSSSFIDPSVTTAGETSASGANRQSSTERVNLDASRQTNELDSQPIDPDFDYDSFQQDCAELPRVNIPNSQPPPNASVRPPSEQPSLPFTIEHLRSNIDDLSRDLGVLQLRRDVTTMNDTMHLQEEVHSLRAAVHFIRLQQHSILMERRESVLAHAPPLDVMNASHLTSEWEEGNPNGASQHNVRVPGHSGAALQYDSGDPNRRLLRYLMERRLFGPNWRREKTKL